MINPQTFKLAVRRFLIILAISSILVWAGSELAHDRLKSSFERPPQTIALTIPYGTAVKVEAGVEESSIPAELSFVEGDTLVVYNDDNTPHELGPLFIPAGSSASVILEDASALEYSCSFRPSKYLGLTVHETTDVNVRLIAITYVSPATAIIIFVYSLAVRPIKPDETEEEKAAAKHERV